MPSSGRQLPAFDNSRNLLPPLDQQDGEILDARMRHAEQPDNDLTGLRRAAARGDLIDDGYGAAAPSVPISGTAIGVDNVSAADAVIPTSNKTLDMTVRRITRTSLFRAGPWKSAF